MAGDIQVGLARALSFAGNAAAKMNGAALAVGI
jgi:hypothetical protein